MALLFKFIWSSTLNCSWPSDFITLLFPVSYKIYFFSFLWIPNARFLLALLYSIIFRFSVLGLSVPFNLEASQSCLERASTPQYMANVFPPARRTFTQKMKISATEDLVSSIHLIYIPPWFNTDSIHQIWPSQLQPFLGKLHTQLKINVKINELFHHSKFSLN